MNIYEQDLMLAPLPWWDDELLLFGYLTRYSQVGRSMERKTDQFVTQRLPVDLAIYAAFVRNASSWYMSIEALWSYQTELIRCQHNERRFRWPKSIRLLKDGRPLTGA